MSLLVSVYTAILFFILTPGILLTLPKGGKKYTVAAVHALVFGLIYFFTHKLVWRLGTRMEGMTTTPPATVDMITSPPATTVGMAANAANAANAATTTKPKTA